MSGEKKVDLLGDLSGLTAQNIPSSNAFLIQPADIQLNSKFCFFDIIHLVLMLKSPIVTSPTSTTSTSTITARPTTTTTPQQGSGTLYEKNGVLIQLLWRYHADTKKLSMLCHFSNRTSNTISDVQLQLAVPKVFFFPLFGPI